MSYQRVADHSNSDVINQHATQVLLARARYCNLGRACPTYSSQTVHRGDRHCSSSSETRNEVVDVARRSSLDRGPWNDYYYHSSRASSPAGLASVPEGSPNSRSRPRPPRPGARRQQQQQQKQYPNNQHRYTVSDRRQDMPGPVVCAPVRSGEGSAGTMVQLHKRKFTNYSRFFSASHSSTRSGCQ